VGSNGGAGRVFVKKYVVGSEVIVAACDEGLLGQRLVDEEAGVNFYVDPYFYKGEQLSVEEAVELLSSATIGNIVGERIVQASIEKGLIHPDAIVRVKGVPIAQFAKM